MTQTEAENRTEVQLSGRELARQRRKAMAEQGKPAVKRGHQASTAAGNNRDQSSTGTRRDAVAKTVRPAASAAAPTGRTLARQRRQAMARGGKSELPQARTAADRARAGSLAPAAEPASVDSGPCSCGCQKEGDGRRQAVERAASRSELGAARHSLTPKEISERMARNRGHGGGREIAQARRKALTQEGKAGLRRAAQATRIAKYLPEKDWRSVIEKGVTGRQVAMQRRKVRALTGRGERDADRKVAEHRRAGSRRTARDLSAPPKVKEGHTLSGREVTGTMVERARQVTGNESGSCREITGTEYIGLEQFDAFCQTRPLAGPAKVTLSRTLQGRSVSGSDVAPKPSVTGTEQGACRELTGTQYLSADFFESVCSTKPRPPADKVDVSQTDKGRPLTGSLMSREGRVTGGESGSAREITGTRYGRSPGGGEVPGKVAVTHTASGNSVTGTALGHSARITGDEPGVCRAVSGTEYLSAEQYTEVCASEAPRQPLKVSVMSTPRELPVTGSAVGRDRKVTGGESGSCRSITGTPYFNSQDFGDVCAVEVPGKVGTAFTQGGSYVSGTEVRPDPKMSGDEEGRCALVTGTDYVGAQDLREACDESTPPDRPVVKSQVDQTWTGEPITGSALGRSARVTGDEAGSCAPISGSSYIGQAQYARYCEPQAVEEQMARVPTHGVVSAAQVTGDRPGAGGSSMTGDERGACEPITGTPYLGADNLSAECATGAASGRYFSRRGPDAPTSRSPSPQAFSVVSPAREAFDERQGRDVTGAQVGGERITGSANRAQGLITGTPEFRHRETLDGTSQTERAASTVRQRLTGEAAQRSARITGDAWGSQSRVTGTEGHFAMSRNQTQRGAPRGEGRSASGFRGLERLEVPESPVTGSAGATKRGAVVTVSGGARG